MSEKLNKRKELRGRMLYWDTSLRNPERSRDFLKLLVEHENKIVNSYLKEEVETKAVMEGLYRPTKNPYGYKETYSRDEALNIMAGSPQNHQQGGKKGYASRFSTHFYNSRQLGFIHESLGDKLIISKSGHRLIKLDKEEGQTQQVYQNALSRYQTTIPFTNNKNRITPFSLLLKLIKIYIKNNKCGVPLEELPIIMCWNTNNADDLYKFLQRFRCEYDPINSMDMTRLKKREELNNVILKYCAKIYGDEYSGLDKKKKFKLAGDLKSSSTVLRDYPDVYLRYLRITGLVYNKKEKNKWWILYDSDNKKTIDYIISKYSTVKDFKDDIDYLKYSSNFDKYFSKNIQIQKHSSENDLKKWVDEFGLDFIRDSLLKLGSMPRKKVNHEILKYMEDHLVFEWLLSLYTYAVCNDKLEQYIPNYNVNADGQPTSNASGQKPGQSGADAIAFTGDEFFILEPTLLTGAAQHNRESYSNRRHLETELLNNPDKAGYCLQISPKPYIDSTRVAQDNKRLFDLNMKPIAVSDYIEKIDQTHSLRDFFE